MNAQEFESECKVDFRRKIQNSDFISLVVSCLF
jgi:hypothetical protein